MFPGIKRNEADRVTWGYPGYGPECCDDPDDAGASEACETRTGHFTGQLICTKCAPGCVHYICTDTR